MEAVHPEEAFRDRATAMTRKVSAAQTALSLNRAVYQALAAIPAAKADPATRYYLQRQLLEFRLSGVDKVEAVRTRLKKLNDELTEEVSAFERNINDGQKIVEVRDAAELTGLPQDYLDAHKPDKNGVIHITTDYPDYGPVMDFSASDALRRRISLAFNTRAFPQNRDVLSKMLRCFVLCSLAAILLLVSSALLFGLKWGNPLKLAVAMAAWGVSMTGLLALIFALAHTKEQANVLSPLVLLVCAMLGGSMFPYENLPVFLQKLGQYIPNRWAVLALQGVARSKPLAELVGPLAGLVALGAGGSLLAFFLFKRRLEDGGRK